MSISKDTYDPAKRYRQICFHQDRDLLDSELNELQAILTQKGKRLSDIILRNGSIIERLDVTVAGNVVTISSGKIYINGSIEDVPGATLTFDPDNTTGADIIYAELLREVIGVNQDSDLVNIYTGEPTAERERWTVTLQDHDISSDPLPTGALGRVVVPLFIFDRETGEVQHIIQERSNLALRDFQGVLDGSRISLASITEDQLGFAAAEGLTSLLQNLAERTYDQAGSYVVHGLDSFIGGNDGTNIEVHTNAGRAYIRGFRFQLDLPKVTSVPKSAYTRRVEDELKFYTDLSQAQSPIDCFYWLNSRPVKEIEDVRANAEVTRNITKGPPGGVDTLPLTPVVDIVEIRQGGTAYLKGVDFQQSGNTIDWLGVNEPASGTTYEATWIQTRELKGQKLSTLAQDIEATDTEITVVGAAYDSGDIILIDNEMIEVIGGGFTTFTVARGVYGSTPAAHSAGAKVMLAMPDFILGGAFGQIHPEHVCSPGTFHYLVTAEDDTGETEYVFTKIKTIETPLAGMNKLTWPEVAGAKKYHIYRSHTGTSRGDFIRMESLDAGSPRLYYDFGQKTDNTDNPQFANQSAGLYTPNILVEAEDTNFILILPNDMRPDFEIMDGSPIIIDYLYVLGRRDILYATTSEIKHFMGQPAENPKAPIAPEGALLLAEIYCPPDSQDLELRNLGLTRVTMEQIHRMMRDIEDLKYNDALSQMNQELEGRDATQKKGIYTDDFSSDVQSDLNHAEWNARIDTIQRFVAPKRTASGHLLSFFTPSCTVQLRDNIVILPFTEEVLAAQEDFSESIVIPPPTPTFKETLIEIIPNVIRPGWGGVMVRASGLTPNVNNVSLYVAGRLAAGNLSTDEQGNLYTSMTVPVDWNLPSGDRSIEITDGQVTASTTVRIADETDLSRVESVVVDWSISDPDALPPPPQINRKPALLQVQPRLRAKPVSNLAQTFLATENCFVNTVGLFFTAKDTSLPITVKLASVTNGLPTAEILAHKTLAPADIQLDSETKVTFPHPVYLQEDTVYAIVLSTPSSQYQVMTATVGQEGQNGYITSQAYERGNLLLGSSNPQFVDGIWQSQVNSDLTMKLYKLKFQPTGNLIYSAMINANFTGLGLDTYSLLPDNTNLKWELSTDGGSTWMPITPEIEMDLPQKAVNVQVRCEFQSVDNKVTPILLSWSAIIGYEVALQGTYVSRMMEVTDFIENVTVYAQTHLPSGCTVSWYASNDNGQTWEQLSMNDARAINAVWTEYKFTGKFSDPTGRQIRFKAEMTSNGALYPKIHRLGATLS